MFLAGKSVRIQARAGGREAACPACGVWSRRVHSRYQRQLADAAAGGQEMLVHLQVRRFFCGNSACAKVTFAEQVPGLASRYGRRTRGLDAVLQAIALALGGRAGARLSGRLAASASRSTLLRLIRALPDPKSGQVSVLGVDDFALRKGRVYGTVVADAESGEVLDLLPDREAATLEAWLKAHCGPGRVDSGRTRARALRTKPGRRGRPLAGTS